MKIKTQKIQKKNIKKQNKVESTLLIKVVNSLSLMVELHSL